MSKPGIHYCLLLTLIAILWATLSIAAPNDDGHQQTIAWWYQIIENNKRVEKMLQDTYARVEQQLGPGNQEINKEFARQITSSYPGSAISTFSPGGEVAVEGRSYRFGSNWQISDMRQQVGSLKKEYSFAYANRYRVSDGTNSVSLLLNRDNPSASYFDQATVAAIAVDAKNTFLKRNPNTVQFQFGSSIAVIMMPLAVIMNDVYKINSGNTTVRMDEFADSIILTSDLRGKVLAMANDLYASGAVLPGKLGGVNAIAGGMMQGTIKTVMKSQGLATDPKNAPSQAVATVPQNSNPQEKASPQSQQPQQEPKSSAKGAIFLAVIIGAVFVVRRIKKS